MRGQRVLSEVLGRAARPRAPEEPDMAHNITTRDSLFTVREPAWHGLGTVLADYPTREEAQQLAHPWEPVSAPLFRRVLNPDLTEHFEEVSTHQEMVRSDDGHHLGVVTNSYTPVTNGEMYDVAEALQGVENEVRFETGGSLFGGSKVWLLLRLNEPIAVKGDPRGESIAYYALQNSHDGGGSFRGQATMTRIVCDNTSQMADLDAKQRGTEFVFRHTSSIKDRIEDAKMALAGWRAGVANWSLQMEHLLDLEVDAKQADWFMRTFIPEPPAGATVSDRVLRNVDEARMAFTDILHSETVPEEIRGTSYGLYQAGVEWWQHSRAARATTIEGRMESRFRRAYLEPSAYTSSAVEVAMAAASV
jgi:phage/plasmid-like protein (TIGR03299 family)